MPYTIVMCKTPEFSRLAMCVGSGEVLLLHQLLPSSTSTSRKQRGKATIPHKL